MKQATIHLKLSKEHEVPKFNVTPIEVLLLCAEHGKAVGGNPVEVHKATITEAGHWDESYEEKEQDVDTIVNEGGKKVIKTVKEKVRVPKRVFVADKRSIDDELDRLRAKYGEAKVDYISSKYKELPTEDFDKAIQMGNNTTIPGEKFAALNKKP